MSEAQEKEVAVYLREFKDGDEAPLNPIEELMNGVMETFFEAVDKLVRGEIGENPPMNHRVVVSTAVANILMNSIMKFTAEGQSKQDMLASVLFDISNITISAIENITKEKPKHQREAH